jgi:hypothetical protein
LKPLAIKLDYSLQKGKFLSLSLSLSSLCVPWWYSENPKILQCVGRFPQIGTQYHVTKTLTSSSGVAVYVIFLTTLYDIILLWCDDHTLTCNHDWNLSLEVEFLK